MSSTEGLHYRGSESPYKGGWWLCSGRAEPARGILFSGPCLLQRHWPPQKKGEAHSNSHTRLLWGSALCSLGAQDPRWGESVTILLNQRNLFFQGQREPRGGNCRCIHPTWWRKGDCSTRQPGFFQWLLGCEESLLCYSIDTRQSLISSSHSRCSMDRHL